MATTGDGVGKKTLKSICYSLLSNHSLSSAADKQTTLVATETASACAQHSLGKCNSPSRNPTVSHSPQGGSGFTAQDSVCMKASASWELHVCKHSSKSWSKCSTQVTTPAKQVTTANPPAGPILAAGKQ